MSFRLVVESGPTVGTEFALSQGEEWTLGRDPDESTLVLEDRHVSRKHLHLRATTGGILVENLSETTPAVVNGDELHAPLLLQEGDRIQVGETTLVFTGEEVVMPDEEPEDKPQESVFSEDEPHIDEDEEEPYDTLFEREGELPEVAHHVNLSIQTRWLLKVVSGPNSGAEVQLEPGHTYMMGTDSATCDIVFHDLSVSRQHARILVSEDDVPRIEDLGSRNGVVIDGRPITDVEILSSNNVVAIGTTSFLIIDREGAQETIMSELPPPQKEEKEEPTEEDEEAKQPQLAHKPKPIISGGAFILLIVAVGIVITAVFSTMSLFRSEPVHIEEADYTGDLDHALKPFPDVRYTFTKQNGRLFILGHVLTPVDKAELSYNLDQLAFITGIDDNVVVDQNVWEETNKLLATNSTWAGVSMYANKPGSYILSGYLKTAAQYDTLWDYIQRNFTYLDKLDNQVVVEEILLREITSSLVSKGLSGVVPSVVAGDVTLTGYVGKEESSTYDKIKEQISHLRGVRGVKDLVIIIAEDKSMVDLTGKFKVQGFSKHGGAVVNVLIDGQIIAVGDTFQGMEVKKISSSAVILERNGVNYKIDYRSQ